MSLGLGDLKKKHRHAKSNATEKAPAKPKVPSGSWAARTARPWTDSDLSPQQGSSSKKRTPTDAVVNEEWMNLSAAPLYWIDFTKHSRLLRIQSQLAQLEEKIHSKLEEPLSTLRRFWGSKKSICI